MIEPKKTWCCTPVAKKEFPKYELNASRLKLWDLSSHYFCSVIGTCVPSNDLRTIARKSGVNGVNKSSDYDLHRLATSVAGDDSSRFARLIQNYLEKKSKALIEQLSHMSANGVSKYWQESLDRHDVKTCYWVFLTHPMTSESMGDKAFADIHMRSHLADRHLSGLHQEIESLKQKLQSTENKSQTRLTDLRQLQRDCKQLKALSKQSLESTLDAGSSSEVLRLRIEAENLTAKLNMERLKREELQDELRLAQSSNNLLQDKLTESGQRLDSLKLRSFISDTQNQPDSSDELTVQCEESCNNPDLAGRCIVYVGGRTRQCGRFKNIVQKINGKFLHHDGGLEDTNRLDLVLAKADAVMCPLDCVSHNAMVKARKYCKSNGTPLIMLDKSSLTAFSSGLEKVLLQ